MGNVDEIGASRFHSGPLLFNIFMNDLFFFIEKCQLYKYADDNSLDSSSKNLVDDFISCVLITKWSGSFNLTICCAC